MIQEEILRKVVTYLNSQLRGSVGSIQQEPYRTDAFKLFAEAYNQGLVRDGVLGADPLHTAVLARWLTHDEEDRAKMELLDKLDTCWHEWQYAWGMTALGVACLWKEIVIPYLFLCPWAACREGIQR